MTAYVTVEEYLAWSDPDGDTPTGDALTIVELALDSAAEAIDAECFRTFTPASSATSATRTFRARASTWLDVDDFTGTATIGGVEFTAIPVIDQGRPYNALEGTFTVGDDYDVVAEWGWPDTPPKVKLANLMLAAKLDQRRQSPNGIERGSDDVGFIRILGVDKDVQELLKKYVRVARSFA